MNANLQGQLPTIDVRNRQELQWWAKELNVSEDQLRGAISRVGSSADAVREVLKTSRVDTAEAPVQAPRGEAATSAGTSRSRDAASRAAPWLVAAAAIAGVALVARRWARPSGIAAAAAAAGQLRKRGRSLFDR
jgi:hypothetical protein